MIVVVVVAALSLLLDTFRAEFHVFFILSNVRVHHRILSATNSVVVVRVDRVMMIIEGTLHVRLIRRRLMLL